MDIADVVAPDFDAHLAYRFEEGQRLNVAHRAADFDDGHFGTGSTPPDEQLDFVRDVRNHLHGAAKVVAVALLLDHALVDLAGREVVALAHLGADEALVMAEVKVGLRTVVGDEHFAVLEGAHGARIHIDVGIQLEHRNLEAARLEDGGKGGGSDTFA